MKQVYLTNLPARNSFAIVPDDNTDLGALPRAVFIGTGGNVALKLADDSGSVVLKNIPSGTILPVQAVRILSTGTTAADLVGLY